MRIFFLFVQRKKKSGGDRPRQRGSRKMIAVLLCVEIPRPCSGGVCGVGSRRRRGRGSSVWCLTALVVSERQYMVGESVW